jgi:hypothetical protein
MVKASEIRENVGRLLFGDISLEQFEDWFVPATWDAHKAGDPEAESLADDIEMNLSEYTGGQLSEEQLRARLAGAVFPSAENRYGDPSTLPTPASSAELAINLARG